MPPREFWFTSPPSSCAYLPAEVCRLDYRLIPGLDDARFADLLDRGWRRFGYQLFRPRCPACARCRSLRVKVADFKPNKAQRRALTRNGDVRLEVGPASVSNAHVALYNRYHRFMAAEKGWPEQAISRQEYAEHFLGGQFSFGREFLYFLAGTLVAVGLVDVTARTSSSAYFFHEPLLRERALGTFSLLKELEYAREHQIAHHHLGYWVPECPSMLYKGAYHPMELLVGYPRDDEEPAWVDENDWRPVLNKNRRSDGPGADAGFLPLAD